jgi:hypothetical protein
MICKWSEESMPTREAYEDNATIVIRQLFPMWPAETRDALIWLLVDFLLSLDGICSSMPDPDHQ